MWQAVAAIRLTSCASTGDETTGEADGSTGTAAKPITITGRVINTTGAGVGPANIKVRSIEHSTLYMTTSKVNGAAFTGTFSIQAPANTAIYLNATGIGYVPSNTQIFTTSTTDLSDYSLLIVSETVAGQVTRAVSDDPWGIKPWFAIDLVDNDGDDKASVTVSAAPAPPFMRYNKDIDCLFGYLQSPPTINCKAEYGGQRKGPMVAGYYLETAIVEFTFSDAEMATIKQKFPMVMGELSYAEILVE